MKDLDTIANAWGDWKATQFGTTKWFTESTQYERNKDTIDYLKYQTRVDAPSALVYSHYQIEDSTDTVLLGKYDTENNTSQTVTHTVNLQKGFNDTFSWSISEQVKVGVAVKIKAGIPFIGEAETTATMDLMLSSTQGVTETKISNYGATTQVHIAPFSRGWGETHLSFTTLKTTWTGDVNLVGYIAVWFNERVDYFKENDFHHLWFIPIQQVFHECDIHGIIDTSGYIINHDKVIARASGAFQSSVGIYLKTKSNEELINNPTKPNENIKSQIIIQPLYDNLDYKPIIPAPEH